MIPAEEIEEFLKGSDPEQYIVSVEFDYVSDSIYKIIEDPIKGKIVKRDTFIPFAWVGDLRGLNFYQGSKGLQKEAMSKYGIVIDKLKNTKDFKNLKPKDVVLYGFGRIGRLLAREMMSKMGKGEQLRLRAIVTRDRNDASSLEKRASLLRYDSVHGDFHGSVQADAKNNVLIINGTTVHVITANSPEEIDYTQYGIEDALVIDNTGAFTTEEQLKRHLSSKGVSKVLLTAPGKGVPNIVYGVNHTDYNPENVTIFSAASCTTNAITPVLKVVEDNLNLILIFHSKSELYLISQRILFYILG